MNNPDELKSCRYCGFALAPPAPSPAPSPAAPDPPAAPASGPHQIPGLTDDDFWQKRREELRQQQARRLPIKIALYLLFAAIACTGVYRARSAKGMGPLLITAAWLFLATRPLTSYNRSIRSAGIGSRQATVSVRAIASTFASRALCVGMAAVGGLALLVAAFRRDVASSKWSFLGGLILFSGSLITKWRYKDGGARVLDPSFQEHVEDFGLGVALVRQYFIWGLILPIVHASFRLFG